MLPSAIAFDSQGNLFVADAGAHVVRELSVGGTVSVVAGTGVQGFAGDGGAATNAQLDCPMGLAIDTSGNLFISDSHNHRVRRVAAGGTITTVAGNGIAGFGGDGIAAKNAALDRPTGLAVDRAGNLYIADTGNHRIRKIDAVTGKIATLVANGIQGFAGDTGSAASASVDSPYGIAVDGDGNLFIADGHNRRIRRVDAGTGVITTVAGNGSLAFGLDGSTASAAPLGLPRGVSVNADGSLLIADTGNQRIRRISPAGTITTVAGGPVQGFSGDGSTAISATLNSPSSVAVSPAGLVTLADAGNRRVRQIASATESIDSLPRLSVPASPTLTFTGPAIVTYGTGTFTAKFTGAGSQGQTVAIADVTSGSPIAMGTAVLNSTGTANWSSASLPAGKHLLQGTCSGFSSTAIAVNVQPAPVTATAADVSLLYAQPVPSLRGVLDGVLARDASLVSATWATAAGQLSAPGTYSISASLAGAAAGNYTISSVTGSVVIAKAPSAVTLAVSAAPLTPGAPLVLTPQVASTTSGVPSGTVSLMDGTSLLGTAQASTAFTTTALAAGVHQFSAVYSGDANFLPASSSPTTVTIAAPASDFAIANAGASRQTVVSGTAATFQFNVTMQGAVLSSPILLTVQGIPSGATASLNPASVPPGSASSFTLTVQTPKASLNVPSEHGVAWWAVFLIPAGMWSLRRTRRFRLAILSGSCILMALLPTGCGDRVNSSSGQSHTSTYTIIVTGTATGPSGTALQHSANVTLEVY